MKNRAEDVEESGPFINQLPCRFMGFSSETYLIKRGIPAPRKPQTPDREVPIIASRNMSLPIFPFRRSLGDERFNCLEVLLISPLNREYSAMKKLNVPTNADPNATLSDRPGLRPAPLRMLPVTRTRAVIIPSARPIVAGNRRLYFNNPA